MTPKKPSKTVKKINVLLEEDKAYCENHPDHPTLEQLEKGKIKVSNLRMNEIQKKIHPLQKFISETKPMVSKLKTQITFENCEELLKIYTNYQIAETLDAMENKVDLAKKYSSVFLTLTQWLKNAKTKIEPMHEFAKQKPAISVEEAINIRTKDLTQIIDNQIEEIANMGKDTDLRILSMDFAVKMIDQCTMATAKLVSGKDLVGNAKTIYEFLKNGK